MFKKLLQTGADKGKANGNVEDKNDGFHEFPEEVNGSNKRWFKRLGIAGGILLVLILILLILVGIPLYATYQSAQKLQTSVAELSQSTKSQNLDQMSTSLTKVYGDLRSVHNNVARLAFLKPLPWLGRYWSDADNATNGGLAGIEAGQIVIKTVSPYSDIIGFNGGQKATDGSKTAQDRINFLVKTIGSVVPQLDPIAQKTGEMANDFNQIDPNRYPVEFQGKQVREPLRKLIDLVNQAHKIVTGGKPVLEQAPYLLGTDSERTYLFLWQNDKELRPTGGFLTAYSIVKVKNGKFQPVVSNDIYNLDKQFNSKIPAPDPIKKYLPLVTYWNLRDMNLSPDFKVSMDTFVQNYQKTNSPAFDGIVSVDTKPIVDLLKVIGQIGVPGFGNFTAENDSRCNCPGVIYELESYADVAGPIVWDDISGKIVYKPPHADNRKAILGPLMNSVLANAMGQPKNKIPDLFQAGFNALEEKHIMLYFQDPNIEKAMEAFNLAGRIVDYDGDYLHVNDTNFAGAKSNLYVTETVDLKVDPSPDGTTNTLTINYANPQKVDNWLNGVYRDWVRVYVPKGSQLLNSNGSEVSVNTSEDLGKTVFDGFFTLRPSGVTQLTFKYKTPMKGNNGYKILIQKQPGTDANLYDVQVRGNKEEINLKTDQELHF